MKTRWNSTHLTRMHELMQVSSRQIMIAVITGALTLGTAFALAAVSGYLITKAWTMPPVLDLSVAVVSVRALGISRGVFRYLERLFTHDAALAGVSRLRTNLYAGLALTPSTRVNRLRRGDLLSSLGDDAEDMANDVIRAVVPSLVALVMAVVVLATIAPFSPLAALFMLVGLAIACLASPFFAFRAALFTERTLLHARAELSAVTMHTIDHADTLLVTGRFSAAQADLAAAQESYDRALDKAAMPQALSRAFLHIAMIPALLGSVLAAGYVFTTPGQGFTAGFMGHTPGIIGVLLLLPLSSFEAASVLPQAAAQRARTLVAAERLSLLDAGHEPVALTLEPVRASAVGEALRRASEQAQSDLTVSAPARPRPRKAHEIEVSHAQAPSAAIQPFSVHLHAGPLTVGWDTSRPLGRTPELDLPAGSRALIYGSSGRGKTTFAMTLAGLIAPLDGHVSVNGRPLTDFSEAEQRHMVKFFAEDAHIFATSLRENIRVVHAHLSDAEISAALERAGLGEWLASLPRGLDTPLGSHGTDVSGGQRRRLLLARAIAAQAPVTILDEPTEHLDMELADSLMTGILTPGEFFDPGITVVVITHDTRFKDRGIRVIDLDTMTPVGSGSKEAYA